MFDLKQPITFRILVSLGRFGGVQNIQARKTRIPLPMDGCFHQGLDAVVGDHTYGKGKLLMFRDEPFFPDSFVLQVILLMEEILHHLGCIKPCK